MKSTPFRWCAALVVGLLFPPSSSSAQTNDLPAVADGLWWEVSAVAGGARLTCDVCTSERDLGGGVGLAIGTYAAPNVRVGLEGGAWSNGGRAIRESIYEMGVEAAVHPRADSGLHLVGGLGWAGYRAGDADPDPDADPDVVRYDSLRLRLGAGWDLSLPHGWVAGNRVTVDAASFGSLQLDGVPLAESVGLSLVRFSLYVRHR